MLEITTDVTTYQINYVKQMLFTFKNKITDEIEFVKVNYIKRYNLDLYDNENSKVYVTCSFHNIELERKFNDRDWIINNILFNCFVFDICSGKNREITLGMKCEMNMKNLRVHHDVDDIDEINFELEGFLK